MPKTLVLGFAGGLPPTLSEIDLDPRLILTDSPMTEIRRATSYALVNSNTSFALHQLPGEILSVT